MPLVTWQVLLYALLSLTAIRMSPVLLALLGSGLRLPEKLSSAGLGHAAWPVWFLRLS